jgi:[FeFe] hydrogenase H-cluster maturation GTPase HydF
MESTPKSLRMQIGLFGRTNVGKSSFLNMIAGQDIAIISHLPGTTTDVVEKAIELLPIGPVTILDTAGIDDNSLLAEKRIQRTLKIFDRAELVVLIIEPNVWTDFEEEIVQLAKKQEIPIIIAINKIDLSAPGQEFIESLSSKCQSLIQCSSIDSTKRNLYLNNFKNSILKIIPSNGQSLPLLGDLVSPGGVVVLIVPIDLQAPKGRLILPQVQAIRDLLDNDAIALVVKDKEYAHALTTLKNEPDLVICDSQVVMKMVADTPSHIKCTTFSILFSRFKGDLVEEVRGAAMIDNIHDGDKILIAEACSHHPLQDDIGRVKIPRWLRQYLGENVHIDFSAGRDYPSNLKDYKLVIHCGGCMLTRTEKLNRIQKAKEAGVPITNYGITISYIQGVLERVLSPFPAALEALNTSEVL